MNERSRERLIANARAALQRGDTQATEAHCRKALALDSNDAAAWTLLGTALRHRDAGAAEAALRRALECDAGDTDAAFHLANLLRMQGRNADAVAMYRRVLERVPAHPSVLNNLGLALAGAGQVEEAEAVFHSVLAREPHHAQALVNLAHLLCGRKDYMQALAVAQRHLERYGNAPAELWIDIGISQHAQHDYEAAVQSFRRALALAPNDAVALLDLGSVLVDMGDFVSAEPMLRAALAAAPDDAHVQSLLAHCRQQLCAWDSLEQLQAKVVAKVSQQARSRVNPFFLLSMPSSADVQQQAARCWAAGIVPAIPAAPGHVKQRGDRLRVGYVSSDFRAHALAFLATEVWERHDRKRFSTFAYALAPADDSPVRARVRRAFETFRDCSGDTAARIAQQIRDDAIDVLIDLNGYTTHAQSEIFAARPARAQLQWLGYLGTMGATWMDYVLTDRYVAPERMQPFFDERFLYLPDCYCPSDTRRSIASDVPTRAGCGLPDKGLVFCCFNNPYKLLPGVFDIWMRLLQATPPSVLWIAPSNDVAMSNLRREAHARGIDPSRLVFAPRVPIDQHLARHVHADLYLDTWPYNAGTAANDALLMGVPVLTCSGDTMASRVAGSQLHAIGLPELVTLDLAAYEARVMELAQGPDRLAALRAQLADNRARYPLFDMGRFTCALEDALLRAANDTKRT